LNKGLNSLRKKRTCAVGLSPSNAEINARVHLYKRIQGRALMLK